MNLGNRATTILISLLVFLFTAYLCIFAAVPYFANKKDYSKIITDAIQKETGLILLIHNYKIAAAPNLDLNFKADEIQLFYPDKKQFLNIKNADINISTLYLLKKEIKLNKVKAKEFQFSTKLLKSGKTSLQSYLEKNIKQQKTDFVLSQKLPAIDVESYIVKLKDEASSQKFKLKGSNFKITQNIDFKYIDITTNGAFYCFDRKYGTYNVKISTPKALFEDIQKETFSIPANNLSEYQLYADLTSDIKLYEKNGKYESSSGKIDIDNFSIKLDNQQLPPAYFHIITNKDKASLVSKFYTAKNEVSDINAQIKLSKPYSVDMHCVCKKANIKNLQKIAASISKMLKLKNNISDFYANGTISADFRLKTDMKKLASDGSIKISGAAIKHKNIPLNINQINALIDFSNNNAKIKQSSMLVNNHPINISGVVDSNAFGNITVSADNLDLNHILNAFSFLKKPDNIVINSGKISFNANLTGKLNSPKLLLKSHINNFSARDKINNIKLSISNILVNADNKNNTYSGKAEINNVVCSTGSNIAQTIKSESIKANFDDKNLTILPAKFNTGNAKLTISGIVKNYAQNPDIDITAKGNIDSLFVKSLMGKSLKSEAKGYLPVSAEIKGKPEDIRTSVKILSNSANYITPIRITNLSNSLTTVNARLNKDTIVIEDVTLYNAGNLNSLAKDVNTAKFKKLATIKGKIKNYETQPYLENIKINIIEKLTVIIPETNSGKATVSGNINLTGNTNGPSIEGYLAITDINIPQYSLKATSAIVNISKNLLQAKMNNLKINDMLISLETNTTLSSLNKNKLDNVIINADYIDMDYLKKLINLLPQAQYAPGATLLYEIQKGKLNIKSFKMDSIKAANITANISAQNNKFYIKNMFSDAYGGKVAGHITYNLPYTSTHAELQGRNLDAAAAAKDLIPKEQKISGRLNFDASIDMTGLTMEHQMKTLKGRADILIKNGHLGQLGRFEHFLYAQNLLSQKLIYASLNSAKQAIKPKDTGYVTYLKGMIKFSNGYANINPVWTAGPQMSMYITGKINLLTNYTDLQILGRVSSEVSNSMGLLGSLTIKDFIDEHTKYGTAISNLFNFCNSELPEMDISKIPALSPDYKYQTKNFRVLIIGDPESVKSVKSFTWVNPTGTKKKLLTEKVKNAVNNVLPQQQNKPQTAQPVTTQTVIEQPKSKINQPGQPDFLDSIPDYFHD